MRDKISQTARHNTKEMEKIHITQRLSQAHNLRHLVLEDTGIESAMILQWNSFHRHHFLFAKPPAHTGLVSMPRMPPGTCDARLDPELPDAKAFLDTLAGDIV